LVILLSILSKVYMQTENITKIANEKTFAFVASIPESSSNAIDKDIDKDKDI
jgi:hypothetical protein